MRYLFLSSILLTLIITGCQSIKPRHLTPITQNSAETSLPTPFTSPAFEKVLFKASLDIGKHHMTGLVFIKKIPEAGYRIPDLSSNRIDTSGVPANTYRLVFSNEFGMTYFDVEVEANQVKVNYCFEPLNKKMLWKILETDFNVLFAGEEDADTRKCFIQDGTNYQVYKSKSRNLTCWHVYYPDGNALVEVRGKSTIADQSLITFSDYVNGFPSRISMMNPIIKLKFSLSLISIN